MSKTTTCSIEGCDKPVRARTWCVKHYSRWQRQGDPLAGRDRFASPAAAFVARTTERGECIVWTGSRNGKGYGEIHTPSGKQYAHRYAWEQANGPIPEGMVVDHVCYNRSCVKPEHLRLARIRENQANRSGSAVTHKTGGVRNVYAYKYGYAVQIGHGGKTHHFGTFKDPDEARAVAAKERARLFGEFAGKD